MCFRPFLRRQPSPQLGPNSQLRGVLFLFHLVGEDIILPFQNIFSLPFGSVYMFGFADSRDACPYKG